MERKALEQEANIEKIVRAFDEIINEVRMNNPWQQIYEKERKAAKKNRIRIGVNAVKDAVGIGPKNGEIFAYTLPERNKIIALGSYFGWDIKKTNQVLEEVGYSKLYARSLDDVIWMLILKEGRCSEPIEKFDSYRDRMVRSMSLPILEDRNNWEAFMELEFREHSVEKKEIKEATGKQWNRIIGSIQDRKTIIRLAFLWGWSVEKTNRVLESVHELKLYPWFDQKVMNILESIVPDSKYNESMDEAVNENSTLPKSRQPQWIRANRGEWGAFYEKYKKDYALDDVKIQQAWKCDRITITNFKTAPKREGIFILACLAGWKTSAADRLLRLMGFATIDVRNDSDVCWSTIMNAGGSNSPALNHAIYMRKLSGRGMREQTETGKNGQATQVVGEYIEDILSCEADLEVCVSVLFHLRHLFHGAYQKLWEYILDIMYEKPKLCSLEKAEKNNIIAIQKLEQERCPKQQHLLGFSIMYGLTLRETNRLLRKGGFAPLSLDAVGSYSWLFLSRVLWEMKKGEASYTSDKNNKEYLKQIRIAEGKLKEKLSNEVVIDEANYYKWMSACFKKADEMKLTTKNGIAGIAWHYM